LSVRAAPWTTRSLSDWCLRSERFSGLPRRSPAEPAMETFATIIGVLTVVGWVADQTLGDVRAILRSERRRRR